MEYQRVPVMLVIGLLALTHAVDPESSTRDKLVELKEQLEENIDQVSKITNDGRELTGKMTRLISMIKELIIGSTKSFRREVSKMTRIEREINDALRDAYPKLTSIGNSSTQMLSDIDELLMNPAAEDVIAEKIAEAEQLLQDDGAVLREIDEKRAVWDSRFGEISRMGKIIKLHFLFRSAKRLFWDSGDDKKDPPINEVKPESEDGDSESDSSKAQNSKTLENLTEIQTNLKKFMIHLNTAKEDVYQRMKRARELCDESKRYVRGSRGVENAHRDLMENKRRIDDIGVPAVRLIEDKEKDVGRNIDTINNCINTINWNQGREFFSEDMKERCKNEMSTTPEDYLRDVARKVEEMDDIIMTMERIVKEEEYGETNVFGRTRARRIRRHKDMVDDDQDTNVDPEPDVQEDEKEKNGFDNVSMLVITAILLTTLCI
ncbi:signal peptide-containing protein [Theileria equi strain WA]|uniref:Signal peptide-containing protein n=1 Tax=Theileria equi strain WA TaxID=1537102 RepID=L0AYN8_THEEQ|nr:signal peptide-containing protein [Theileria equi strain WA]AFZ80680.1 signal peptide-containing protein [Theileria equi strain WA]|eukprot:XP_004830346.1 signal peptide-containing protein [Theileria equi strain WA]